MSNIMDESQIQCRMKNVQTREFILYVSFTCSKLRNGGRMVLWFWVVT